MTCRIWGCVYFQCVQRFRGREHGNTNNFLLLSSLYYFTLTLQHGTGQPAHCAILYWRCRTVCVNQPIVLFYINVAARYASILHLYRLDLCLVVSNIYVLNCQFTGVLFKLFHNCMGCNEILIYKKIISTLHSKLP